ncbi:MAG: glycerol kinase GlpK [Sandaracinaceae bacterium]|nr:glycerol kinase GlpK [Sandaracinaceae bacterium]
MARHLLAIDQGTTGSTVVVLAPDGSIVGKANTEFPQHFPTPGWVEHDPDEIWQSVLASLEAALREASVRPDDIAAIGITNQRETTLVWDKVTGAPIHRAIVWQDRRTAPRCAELKAQGFERLVKERTGLVVDPYFSGTKIEWILEHDKAARGAAERGGLAFGTIDSFLVHRLSGGAAHLTDVTNASRTLLYDIHDHRWHPELCAALHVPEAMLPAVRSSSEVYARTKGVPGLADGTPIAGIAGDQQAALFGQTCFEVGDAKCTYGTGAFLLMNTGTTAVPSRSGCLTTIGWRIGDGPTVYALEGSAFIAGAAVQWLRDGLGIIERSADVEALARKVSSAGDVVVVPALVGLGAPHWDPDARGLICGLTRDTTAAHIARATLDGIAYQIADLVTAMERDAGRELRRLRVDGGASQNELLMQFQADLLGAHVDRPASVETTALGAAYLAGLAVGVFADLSAVVKAHRVARTFSPAMAEEERRAYLNRWGRAVARARSELSAT